MAKIFAVTLLILFSIILTQCSFLGTLFSKREGVVTFYNHIPDECPSSKGLIQKVIKPVYSEKELIKHYGITFIIRFQDKVSPQLYGTLYHLNKDHNIYCMALPDGRFAFFQNSKVLGRDNIIQEVCHPLKRCKIK